MKQVFPFNPLKRAEEVENSVFEGEARKYHRFRPARYYGGIATADLVGCCFLCAYCWNYERNLAPQSCEGIFYAPFQVAKIILKIARQNGFNKLRLTGAEPLLGERSFQHFEEILRIINKEAPQYDFILETNGFILGLRDDFIERLSKFCRLYVRVSLKGWDEESFQKISGVDSQFFTLPLEALRNLQKAGLTSWPAVMYEMFGSQGIEIVNEKLKEFGIKPEELEIEYLQGYPYVLENLKSRGFSLPPSSSF